MPRAGYSVIELLIVLGLVLIVGGIAAVVIIDGQRIFAQESIRQAHTAQTRHALEMAVRRLRESAARTAAVNLSVDDAEGNPLIRDGLAVWTDTDHQTVYRVAEGSGTNLPEVFGWDDENGDGLSDVLVIALMRQDIDRDGVHDFIDVNEDGIADDIIKRRGVTDGEANLKWLLVLESFPNLAAASVAANWDSPQILAKNVLPFITVVAGETQYDTIEATGIRAESYDYGHDGDFDVLDPDQYDGRVDEIEMGLVESVDGLINTQGERDLVGSVRFNLTLSEAYRQNTSTRRRRLDVGHTRTAVTPRAYTIVERTGLSYPDPSI